MRVDLHSDPAAFLRAAGALLCADPVVNQLPLAIAQGCVEQPPVGGEPPRFATVADAEGRVVAAAVHTPPWPVQLSEGPPEAAAALGTRFAAASVPATGVGGPERAATAFARAYAAARGAQVKPYHALGVFELTEVAPVPFPPGAMVAAGPDHAPQLQRWLEAFHDEAVPHDPPPPPDAGVRAVRPGRTWLWALPDGTPVAFAMNGRNVEGWASVGPVYTPPVRRGQGYATGLVAALSAHLLTRNRGCTLFTNLGNRTSNALYERIGYRRIGTALRLDLTEISTP